MKYLQVGDAYIGRDGIVTTYPRGEGIDACCIPAKHLLDPAKSRQREIKEFIASSLQAVPKVGVMDSRRKLLNNIHTLSAPEVRDRMMSVLRRGHIAVSHKMITEYGPKARRNELERHLGISVADTELGNAAIAQAIDERRATNADDLFEKAKSAVKEYSNTLCSDPSGRELMRLSVFLQASHQNGYNALPAFGQKLLEGASAVVVLCPEFALNAGRYIPAVRGRGFPLLKDFTHNPAMYLQNSTVTLFAHAALAHKDSNDVVAEESWHLIQDRLYPRQEREPRLVDFEKALKADEEAIRKRTGGNAILRTSGEEKFMHMIADARKQPESFIQEAFANMMIIFTGHGHEAERNNLCTHAPETATILYEIVGDMERVVRNPSVSHQRDYGLGAIPVFAGGKSRSPAPV